MKEIILKLLNNDVMITNIVIPALAAVVSYVLFSIKKYVNKKIENQDYENAFNEAYDYAIRNATIVEKLFAKTKLNNKTQKKIKKFLELLKQDYIENTGKEPRETFISAARNIAENALRNGTIKKK